MEELKIKRRYPIFNALSVSNKCGWRYDDVENFIQDEHNTYIGAQNILQKIDDQFHVELGGVMLNTSWHRKITSVCINSVIFTGRPPLEFSYLTRHTIGDARCILWFYVSKMHVWAYAKDAKFNN